MKYYQQLHSIALRELERRGYRWHTQGDWWALSGLRGQALNKWRLWESVENLDVQLLYAKELYTRAKGRKWTNVREAFKQILHLYDEAISILDPNHWRGRHKCFLTIEPKENVSKVLQNLVCIRRLIYVNRLDLAKLERRGSCWIAYTLMLYIDVLDSIYGCKKWLEAMKNEATK